MTISARGMDVQTARLRVIAEKYGEPGQHGLNPGAAAYRRKTVTFEKPHGPDARRFHSAGEADRHRSQRTATALRPIQPGGQQDGYVKQPNSTARRGYDMREAERSYSANLSVMQATRDMLTRTIQLLK